MIAEVIAQILRGVVLLHRRDDAHIEAHVKYVARIPGLLGSTTFNITLLNLLQPVTMYSKNLRLSVKTHTVSGEAI